MSVYYIDMDKCGESAIQISARGQDVDSFHCVLLFSDYSELMQSPSSLPHLIKLKYKTRVLLCHTHNEAPSTVSNLWVARQSTVDSFSSEKSRANIQKNALPVLLQYVLQRLLLTERRGMPATDTLTHKRTTVCRGSAPQHNESSSITA